MNLLLIELYLLLLSDFLMQTHDVPALECSDACIEQLASEFEPIFGGFGSAPKFPQPVNFNILFHMYSREPSEEVAQQCLHMCVHTLTKMSYGGIHDHIGQVRDLFITILGTVSVSNILTFLSFPNRVLQDILLTVNGMSLILKKCYTIKGS